MTVPEKTAADSFTCCCGVRVAQEQPEQASTVSTETINRAATRENATNIRTITFIGTYRERDRFG
ncbi:hypothetical protein [Nonomuraea cavernae]|uniref:hypothetical protein n=1 Tax=Nonomuraea cavernae TaxID=2045107 RepID=UPI0033DF7F05